MFERPTSVPRMDASAEESAVTVNVAGTVEEARTAGWNHPNCRCRLVAYSPGAHGPAGRHDVRRGRGEGTCTAAVSRA